MNTYYVPPIIIVSVSNEMGRYIELFNKNHTRDEVYKNGGGEGEKNIITTGFVSATKKGGYYQVKKYEWTNVHRCEIFVAVTWGRWDVIPGGEGRKSVLL